MSFAIDLGLNFAECIVDAGRAILGVNQACEGGMRHSETILNAICALLNSGGGVIKIEVEDEDYDSWSHELGLKLPGIFNSHLDMMRQGILFLIFVNSWDVAASSVRLATLCSNLYHRQGTVTEVMESPDALTFLQRKAQALGNGDHSNSLHSQEAQVERIMASAADLFDTVQLQYLEKLNFTESLHVEFQMFPADLTQGMKERLPQYVSAFANTEGGYLFFGVHAESHQVIGCEKEKINCRVLLASLHGCIRKLPVHHFCAQDHKVQYAIRFLEVYDQGAIHGYVCAIKVEPFCCVAFAKAPSSWQMKNDQVKQLTTKEWVSWMIETDPDLSRFPEMVLARSIQCATPRSHAVCAHKSLRCLNEQQQHHFPVSPDRVTYTPDSVYKELFAEHQGLRDLINTEIRPISQGILIFSHSWAVDLGLPKKQGVICEALLISQNNTPILYTICNKWDPEYKHYSRMVAYTLKERLVNMGGYTGRLGIIPLAFALYPDKTSKAIHNLEMPVYPETYNFTCIQQMEALLQSLMIVLLGFSSFLSEQVYSEILTLFTDEQYKLLSKNLHKTREMFVHGLPGSGKTILALRIMEKIKNTFRCQASDILYICENLPLKSFVSNRSLCKVVTRKTFMKNNYDNIRYIIVDEAHNFRTKDGDWYRKAKSITQRQDNYPGILWVFLDYFQTNHLCCIGLPHILSQEPRIELTKGLRNAHVIANYLQDIMQRIRKNPLPNISLESLMMCDAPEWAQGVPGKLEITDYMNLDQMATYVAEKCQFLWSQGYYHKDVAVLFLEESDIEKCKDKLILAMRRRNMTQLEEEFNLLVQVSDALDILANHVVFDTVHRFSGLERKIVFGIIPKGSESETIPGASKSNLFYRILFSLASRAKYQLYIVKVSI